MNDKGPSSSKTETSDDVDGADRSMLDNSQHKTNQQNNNNRDSTMADAQATNRKPSKAKQLWQKTGLDVMTLGMMFKGSVPPLVALCMMQSDSVASQYSTLGYLVAITSVLGFCIMPRGKFVQTMLMNLTAICLAAAVNLLALYTVLQARHNTTSSLAREPSKPTSVPYNSSASVVCAIWLCIQTYLINAVRCALPQYQFPCIVYSIFINISLTTGTQFPSMTIAVSFMQRLLEAFSTGFVLATATHFLILPTTSRKAVFKMMAGYMGLINSILHTQTTYMTDVEGVKSIRMKSHPERSAADIAQDSRDEQSQDTINIQYQTASMKLLEMMDKLTGLHARIHLEIPSARQEVAIGNLEGDDITELWDRLRTVFVPVMGLCSMMNVVEKEAAASSVRTDSLHGEGEARRKEHGHNVASMIDTLHKPIAEMTVNLGDAFEHIQSTLGFSKPPKKAMKSDLESKAGNFSSPPGSSGFAEAYRKRLGEFYNAKPRILQAWRDKYSIDPPANLSVESFIQSSEDQTDQAQVQRNLSLVIYVHYLLWRVGMAMFDLVLFVDTKKQSGALTHSKVIFPGSKTLRHWLTHPIHPEDISHDDFSAAYNATGVSQSVYVGQRFNQRRDPEHDPPRNAIERVGKLIRKLSHSLHSEASVFALRATLATMSVGIVCYLHDTQTFFLRNRLSWSLNVVALSMTRTAGQSFFNFILRVAVTAVAMVGSYIIWYIVDGHTAGVLVFLWLWTFCCFYIVVKMPKLIVAGILGLVTCILAIGYELQVRKIGVQASEGNGQPAYPLYILAPYRLATVIAGIFSAFVWTVFPYPITEATELRKDLGSSMYLMGLYHHLAHESIQGAIESSSSSDNLKDTPSARLQETRNTVLMKLVTMSSQLNANASFSKFQLSVGGRFPREKYESLIECLRRLMLWITLAHHTSSSFEHSAEAGRLKWSNEFHKMLANFDGSSHRITSLLFVLSSSMRNASPLPPHLELPEALSSSKTPFKLDVDMPNVAQMAEHEYSAFAVMQVVLENITVETRELVKLVKELVGEVNFGFDASR